jgi:hypothetical protein
MELVPQVVQALEVSSYVNLNQITLGLESSEACDKIVVLIKRAKPDKIEPDLCYVLKNSKSKVYVFHIV